MTPTKTRRPTRRRSHDERARGRQRRAERARHRKGRTPTTVDRAVEVARENPVTVVAAVIAVVTALGEWAIMAVPASVPEFVVITLHPLVLAVAAAIGKWAQRFTYDRVGATESWGNFIDDLHRVAGTEPPEQVPPGYVPE